MSRPESIADWSPSAASSIAPVLDGDQSACSPRECLNQFTRSTCPTNGDHFIRLVTLIHYNHQIIFILMLLTHGDYSKPHWKKNL